MSNWPGYGCEFSSWSNLSAFAQPFNITQVDPNHSSSQFYGGSAEPPFDHAPMNSAHNNWLNPYSASGNSDWFLNSRPYLNADGYSGSEAVSAANTPAVASSWASAAVVSNDRFPFGQSSDGSRNDMTVGAYPFYAVPGVIQGDQAAAADPPGCNGVSSSFDGRLDNVVCDLLDLEDTAGSTGLWNRTHFKYHGKNADLDGSYGSMEGDAAPQSMCKTGGNEELHASIGTRECEEAPHNADWLNWGNYIGFTTGNYADGSSNLEFPGPFPKAYSQATPQVVSLNLGEEQWQYTQLAEKSAMNGSSSNTCGSFMKSSTAPAVVPTLDDFESVSGVSSLTNHKSGRVSATETYAHILQSGVNEAQSLQTPGNDFLIDSTGFGKGIPQYGSSVNNRISVRKSVDVPMMGHLSDCCSSATADVSLGDHKNCRNSSNELYPEISCLNNNTQLQRAPGSELCVDNVGRGVLQHVSSVNAGFSFGMDELSFKDNKNVSNSGNVSEQSVEVILSSENEPDSLRDSPRETNVMKGGLQQGSSLNVGFGSRIGDISYEDHKNGRDEPQSFQPSQSKLQVDGTDHGILLGRSDCTSVEMCHIKDEDLPNQKHASKDAFNLLPGTKSAGPCLTMDHYATALKYKGADSCAERHTGVKSGLESTYPLLNSARERIHALDFGENPSVGLHNADHAVDSPCWKQTALNSQYQDGPGVNGFELQDSKIFCYSAHPSNFSSAHLSEEKVLNKHGCINRDSASSSMQHAVVNHLGGEVRSTNTADIHLSHSKHHFSHDISETMAQYVLCQGSTYDHSIKPYNSAQQSSGEGKATSDEVHLPTDHTVGIGKSVNDYFERGSPQKSGMSLKDVLGLTELGDTSPELAKLDKGDLLPKLDGEMLVSTLHNLSELLLLGCLKGAYDLKERDHDVLQKVMHNLGACTLKNAKEITLQPSQQKLHNSEVDTNNCSGVTLDHHVGQLSDHSACNKRMQHSMFNNKDKISDEFSSSLCNPLNNDNGMAQAIKEILTENFHINEDMDPQVRLFKNLWLEAEATICSLNYKARFNRMKIEMDKLRSSEGKDSFGSVDIENTSKLGDSVASSADNKLFDGTMICPKLENHVSMQHPGVLSLNCLAENASRMATRRGWLNNCGRKNFEKLEDIGDLKISSDVNGTKELANGAYEETNDIEPDALVKGAISSRDDIEATKDLARGAYEKTGDTKADAPVKGAVSSRDDSGAIKESVHGAYEENSDIEWDASVKRASSSRDDSKATKESALGAYEETGDIEPDAAVEGAINSRDNIEASVMARLKILERRCRNLITPAESLILLDTVHVGSALEEDCSSVAGEVTEKGINFTDGKESQCALGDGQMHHPFPKDKLTPFYAGWSDYDSSSDWEHVMKEEITGGK